MSRNDRQPRIKLEHSDAGAAALIEGEWTLQGLGDCYEDLVEQAQQLASDQHTTLWDLRRVDHLDTAGALLLWRAWGDRRPGRLELRSGQEAVFQRLEALPPLPPAEHGSPVDAVVDWMAAFSARLADHLYGALVLPGQILLDILYLATRPAQIPWREISATLYRTGARALGITALVGLLIGVVVSYLSALQLAAYGADAFIIDVLGITIVRELGPLLAAILVAGRSGSAMTAELGVMRVTEELDALTAMGISPSQRLVLPKVVALAIAMPLLVVWTSGVAMLGGMLAASVELGIGYQQFLESLPSQLPVANLWIAIAKGVVFGIAIALTAAHFGLRVKPNTESLGLETTNSVVTSITIVIVVDAVFAIGLRGVGYA